ncbi:helix-turn-helix transcriptional regulator [Thalassococcus sp. BH17M4-6]|uniref:helix-turn-helix transcriptional regulator n=1 Tax=Thalassococcus sp. BH17M4-6 TaxID=3413148 RepID=UPI003BD0234B
MTDRIAFFLLLLLQLTCALFFLWDIGSSVLGLRSAPLSWALIELIEIGAALGLVLGVAVTAMMLSRSLRARAHAEESLRLASGAFMDVLEERFETWALTPAERDVALFSIKGLSTAEIAALRNTSEGTVKAQTNAIYRKAGVSGRPQLLSLFIDALMGDALPGIEKPS